jgi:serine/threonine protein kinase
MIWVTLPIAAWLRINNRLDVETRASACAQIACGLQCLAEAGIVHRDLAARNVLLCSRPGVFPLALSEKKIDAARSDVQHFFEPSHDRAHACTGPRVICPNSHVWLRRAAPIHVVAAGRPPLCKISDFGLARIMTADNAYVTSDNMHALLPLRWMAPESVRDHVYTAGASTWHRPRGTVHVALTTWHHPRGTVHVAPSTWQLARSVVAVARRDAWGNF